MTGREIENGRSAQAAQASAKPDQSIVIVAAHRKHNIRDIVIAIHRTWNTVRGQIAKGLENVHSLH
jgi:hypothetical protein